MFPSVTTVLSPFADFSRVRPEVLEHAAQRGTKVHALCEAYAQGLWIPRIDEECAGYFDSFKRWFDATVVEVLAQEVELVDEQKGYMGHPDMICRIKGDNDAVMIDLKTPAAQSPAWRLQLAAYWRLGTLAGYPITRSGSLRLKKDGSRAIFNEYTGSHAHDLNVFLNCLAAWKYFNQ